MTTKIHLASLSIILAMTCPLANSLSALAYFNSSTVNGEVTFTQDSEGMVTIQVNVTGLLPPGNHGFHIHANGDVRDGCAAAGGHFNPTDKQHGSPADKKRHAGDFGNVVSDESGDVLTQMTDIFIQLKGKNSIVGRAVVFHEKKDDLGRGKGKEQTESKKSGNAGSRLACAVIGLTDAEGGKKGSWLG